MPTTPEMTDSLSLPADLPPDPPPPEPFRLSPSLLGRYAFHGCDRYLRWSMDTTGASPRPEEDMRTSRQRRLQEGLDWEEELIGQLGERVRIGSGGEGITERRFTVEESLDLFRTAPVGTWIYQPTLQPGMSFRRRYKLEEVFLSSNRPDLIEVRAEIGADGAPTGRRRLQIVDIKRSTSVHRSHRLQILFYALELEDILEHAGIDTGNNAVADVDEGGIWLRDQPAPEAVDLRLLRGRMQKILLHDMQRLQKMAPDQADWLLQEHCEWCAYLPNCRKEANERQDLSLLPGMSPYSRRYLHRREIRSLPDLHALLARPDADQVLAGSAGLAGQRPRLQAQLDALSTDQPRLIGASSLHLPSREDLALFLTAQPDPSSGRPWALGLLLAGDRAARQRALPDDPDEPEAWLQIAQDPADIPRIEEVFLRYLYGLLSQIDASQAAQPPERRLSLQLYIWSGQEQQLLCDLLHRCCSHPELSRPATELLLLLQAPDQILQQAHPAEIRPMTLCILRTALGALMALPIPVASPLPESLAALRSPWLLPRSERFHLPFGPTLRPDAWQEEAPRAELAAALTDQLQAQRWLLRALRQHAGSRLLFRAPPFALVPGSAHPSALLSRLIFFLRFESVIRCLDIQLERTRSPEQLRISGRATALQRDGEAYRVLDGDPGDPGDFFDRLLIRDTPAGWEAQLRWPDFAERRQRRALPRLALSLASMPEIEKDSTGRTVRVWLNCIGDLPQRPEERMMLLRRFTDFTTDKLLSFIDGLQPDSPAVRLLQSPADADSGALIRVDPAPPPGLTPSQTRAWDHVTKNRITAVWGPPGTGKTYFLARLIQGTLRSQERFTVLVSAFTHAAIENLLARLGRMLPGVAIGKVDLSLTMHGVQKLDKKKILAFTRKHPVCVVGATAYALLSESAMPAFDLVLLDEASQIKAPEGLVCLAALSAGGRAVVAGDGRQLGPILAADWPEIPDGPSLHHSLFALLTRPGALTPQMLTENFRMNALLTAQAAALVYGPAYRCASPAVAARRLDYTPAGDSLDWLLDPDYPLVLIQTEGFEAPARNDVEAELVADLCVALRNRTRPEGATAWLDDAHFFRDGAFIVSPHHLQIRAIRQALAARQEWSHPPFVDTVDKMQGQEADAVLVSYGVSDPEQAAREAAFIYSLNRLNVAITRARKKMVLLLSTELLEPPLGVLDDAEAATGLQYMQSLVMAMRAGERRMAKLRQVRVKLYRLKEWRQTA